MKKGFLVMFLGIFMLLLTACSSPERTYYFAMNDFNEDSSWVYWVVIVKEGDKIVDAEWNAFNIQGDANKTFNGMDKYQASVEHKYDMTPGRDQNPGELWWHEQADLIIEKLIATNNINDRIPVPTGATITTDDFYTLAEKAIANGPVEKGEYKDGYHFVSLKSNAKPHAVVNYWDPKSESVRTVAEWDSWTFGSFIVVNGTIKMAYFNNVFNGYRVQFNEQGKIVKQEVDLDNDPETAPVKLNVIADYVGNAPKLYLTKNELGKSYGMSVVSGAEEYDTQARLAGNYLVQNQSFPSLNNDNRFDGMTGVTIHTNDFVSLWQMLPKA